MSRDADDDTSRSDLKRSRRAREEALTRLVRELVALSDKNLERLGLPDSVLEAIYEARAIESPRAKERQQRFLRGLLRDDEWPAFRARLDALRLHGPSALPAPDAPPREGEGKAREWVVRLLGEGKRGLDALIALHPGVDRKHMSTLIRNAAHGAPERRKRAEDKLAQTLELLMR